jgi:hypothetical protein
LATNRESTQGCAQTEYQGQDLQQIALLLSVFIALDWTQ